MSFAQDQKQRNARVWHASMTHAFLQELVDSRLPYESFLFFLHQDVWFRRQRAGVIAIAASRAPDLAASAALSELVASANAAERDRHRAFAERLGRPIDDAALDPAPTAYAYVSHMRSVALDGSFAEILATLAPCTWLYRDFGRHFGDRAPSDPVYRDWLAAYQSPRRDERVREQCELLDRAVADGDDRQRARAARAFEISIRYEHAFWDMALERQTWPDGPGGPAG